MARKEKKQNNLRLAILFAGFIVFVILVSLVFKTVDVFRTSKFDSNNRFSVALVYKDIIDVLTLSPKEGTLSRLTIEGTRDVNWLATYEIPIDSLIVSEKKISGSPKNQFAGMFLNKRFLDSNLTIFDFFNLWLISRKVSKEKIVVEKVDYKDEEKINDVASEIFIDPLITEEEKSITVTNTTKTPGLGNRIADYASNMGGNVILVNTSRDEARESKIYYKELSYTVNKLSRVLGIPTEQRNDNSISDIIVVIGKDY